MKRLKAFNTTFKPRARSTLWVAVILMLVGDRSLLAADSSTRLAEKPEVADALKVLDAWVSSTVQDRELPGLSMGIVWDQELVWAKGYGYADLEKRTPATAATTYRIASISKTFTAHAVLQLRDEGKLSLDDPVGKWIPDLKLTKFDTESSQITLRHILTHTGGVPCEIEGSYWNEMTFPTREAMLPVLNRLGLVWEADKEWKYSNVGISLAGYVVEAASGEGYPEFITRRILDPLTMTGTKVVPEAQLSTLAVGYGRRMPGKPRRTVPFLNAGFMAPAAGVASCVQDLAKYLSIQFRRGPAGGAQILKGTSLAEMQRVQWLQPDWKSGWGLGWEISRRDEKTRVGHGGSIPGYRSQITMVPADKFGVIVLINSDDGRPSLYVDQAYAIVAPAIAKVVSPVADVVRAQLGALQKYVGVYEADEESLHVEVLDGKLSFFSPADDNPWASKVTLEPIAEDTFRMKDGFQVGETLRFVKNEAGQITRLEVPGYHLLRSNP